MAKKVYVTLSLDISDEMFNKLSANMTEEQKKYFEVDKIIPSPGLGFWNGNFVDFLETTKVDVHELIEDLKANDNTCKV